MNYLLDTHVLLWALNNSNNLPENIKEILSNENNNIFVSVASLWEAEIKHLKYPESFDDTSFMLETSLMFTDYNLINIEADDVNSLYSVVDNKVHNDPFDHILLATAKNRGLTLITHDKKMSEYKSVNSIVF